MNSLSVASSLSDLVAGSSPFDVSADNVLTIEELRAHMGSCFTCGVSWTDDHVSLDCIECGGYSSQRPCPLCDGQCGQQWKRDFSMVSDSIALLSRSVGYNTFAHLFRNTVARLQQSPLAGPLSAQFGRHRFAAVHRSPARRCRSRCAAAASVRPGGGRHVATTIDDGRRREGRNQQRVDIIQMPAKQRRQRSYSVDATANVRRQSTVDGARFVFAFGTIVGHNIDDMSGGRSASICAAAEVFRDARSST